MRGFLRRTLQIVGYTFSFVGALLLIAWAVRGARPALECGVIEAARALDWPIAYACLDKADYDPLIGLVTLIVGVLAWLAARFTPDDSSSVYNPTPEERARNRTVLANRVQKTWIDGVLKQSLYEAVLIALGWQPSPESVEMRPWSMKAGRPDEDGTLVPPNKGIAALFDQSEGALLILGEPGAGKTTVLLSLTQELLKRQRFENAHPVPMVFNLSSWQGKEQSIADWLVSELRRFYDVPEQIARHLVDHGEVALMLDGLDEVQSELRNECVAAINAYRSERIVPVALCCRVREYRELKTRLVAQLAVMLQPLTVEQQDGYLDKLMLPEAGRLKAALHADAALREVAESPLMLSVMLGAGDYLRLDNAETTSGGLRTAIWDAYLQNMLNRERKTKAHYPVQQVVQQLPWLAKKMAERTQTVFLLERLDLDWLGSHFSRLPMGLVFAGVFGGLGGLNGSIQMAVIGLIIGLVAGLLTDSILIDDTIRIVWNLQELMKGVMNGLLWGMILGVVSAFVLGQLGKAALFGLLAWPIWGVLSGFILGLESRSSKIGDQYISVGPNAGVHRPLLYSLYICPTAGILAGVLMWYAVGEQGTELTGISSSTTYYFIIITMVMTAIMLQFHLALAHYVFRVLLCLKGYAPLNYVRFLDYCADRILLRKVGGGYIFIHRTFMEHMAEIDPAKLDFDTPASKTK